MERLSATARQRTRRVTLRVDAATFEKAGRRHPANRAAPRDIVAAVKTSPLAAPSPKLDRDLDRLAAMRSRVALGLTMAMLASYFGFILLVAFDKPFLGSTIVPGLSVGIALGASVIAIAWVLTGIYLRWANARWDAEVEAIRREHGLERAPMAPPTEAVVLAPAEPAAAPEGAS